MATSGQIINILGKLGKGLKATEGEERTSKKKEEKQHKKMFSDLQAKFEVEKFKLDQTQVALRSFTNALMQSLEERKEEVKVEKVAS